MDWSYRIIPARSPRHRLPKKNNSEDAVRVVYQKPVGVPSWCNICYGTPLGALFSMINPIGSTNETSQIYGGKWNKSFADWTVTAQAYLKVRTARAPHWAPSIIDRFLAQWHQRDLHKAKWKDPCTRLWKRPNPVLIWD